MCLCVSSILKHGLFAVWANGKFTVLYGRASLKFIVSYSKKAFFHCPHSTKPFGKAVGDKHSQPSCEVDKRGQNSLTDTNGREYLNAHGLHPSPGSLRFGRKFFLLF